MPNIVPIFRGDTNKTSQALQKIAIQKAFLKEFGLDIWKPKSGGGTTMDGRCSRVAFANPEKFSQICGVPVDLIKDFDTLVVALCCGADISPEEFEKKAENWLDRFHGNDDISWNVLSPTVSMKFIDSNLYNPILKSTMNCLNPYLHCAFILYRFIWYFITDGKLQ